MNISIHQPYYMPWMGLFHKIYKTDMLVLLDHVQYADKDMQNRNYIKTTQGKLLLTVPVRLPRHDLPANEVEISYDTDWPRKHLRSIEFNYAKAPYFETYIGYFREVLTRKWKYLLDLNVEIIRFMTKEFKLDKPLLKSSTLGLKSLKNELLIDICKAVKATEFLTGSVAAQSYLDFAEFERNGIRVTIHQFAHPEYRQAGKEFLPNLSAIDLLFNYGPGGHDVIAKG